jgi:hypothetical protein
MGDRVSRGHHEIEGSAEMTTQAATAEIVGVTFVRPETSQIVYPRSLLPLKLRGAPAITTLVSKRGDRPRVTGSPGYRVRFQADDFPVGRIVGLSDKCLKSLVFSNLTQAEMVGAGNLPIIPLLTRSVYELRSSANVVLGKRDYR